MLEPLGAPDNSHMSALFLSSEELPVHIGARARRRRLAMNLLQSDVARRAGTTLSTVRRFEAGANVGFEAVVRIAVAIEAEDGLAALFPMPERRTLDDVLAARPERRRARR